MKSNPAQSVYNELGTFKKPVLRSLWKPWHNFHISENDHEEISEEVEDALAIKLEETVHSLEAKCAGVREELGRMALSEQYMRTKQAQLKAKKKEKEAEEAAKRAAQKELEAAVIAKSDVIVSGLPFRLVRIRIL